MPIFQKNERRLAFAGLAFMAVALPRMACATLGEAEISVQTDATRSLAAIKSSQEREGYRVHEIALASGTLMREFVGPEGKVFAVAWHGPTRPDLRQALGQYFGAFASAPRSRLSDRRHVQIRQGDVVVEGGGHMRALSGRAYLLSAIPSGVSLGDLH
jgi:Protein of unknown function (DUF2844)